MHERAFPFALHCKPEINQQEANMTTKKHVVADYLSSGESSSAEQTALSFSSATS